MTARLWFILAALFMAGCGASTSILPEPFTRERADGKIPVKTELIREQVLARLAGIPEGEAEVLRWQHIETDYHACRLSSKKAAGAAEEVFANCMANRGYVYMYRIDAEQLHNDIEFEIEKEYDKHPDAKQKATEEWLAVKRKREEEQQQFAEQSESPDDGFNATYLYALAGIAGVAALASGGGGGGGGNGNNPSPAQPSITPIPTMPTMTMAMTMTTPTLPPSPYRFCFAYGGCAFYNRNDADSAPDSIRRIGLNPRPTVARSITAPEFGAVLQSDFASGYHFHVFFTPSEGVIGLFDGTTITIQRQMVTRIGVCPRVVSCSSLPSMNLSIWHSESRWSQIREGNGNRLVYLGFADGQIFVEGRPDITDLLQLCDAQWLGDYINQNFTHPQRAMVCDYSSGASYSPNMQRVVHAAMADGFSPGLSFTDSPLSFFGRYDNNDRAAGFTYDFGNYALRTDYTRLPSKQDSNVWLDTYRLGVLHPINDEARFFAGVDNYKNAIFVLDTTGEDLHRLGFAVGDGYAVKYEYRLNL